MTRLANLPGFLVFLLAAASLHASPIVREPGAIYLSDFGDKTLRVTVTRAAKSYFDIGMTRYAGTLRFPQQVQVVAVADIGCRVRGNAQQGGVVAWVSYDDLSGLPKDFLATMKKAEERRLMVEALIAKKEVAIGMTADEVRRSLGKPAKTTKRASKEGLEELWEYVKYDLIPQTTYTPGVTQTVIPSTKPGQPSNVVTQTVMIGNTIYVKVPVGTLKVAFKDNLVDSLDQTEGTLVGAGQVSIVTPPLNVYW
ncbi:hypothetical protein DB345_20350 [Spartobacteria bacterium LR76]|nr:hypothetical protein DB345_20350 [Spartobacteria bacterium LR76]